MFNKLILPNKLTSQNDDLRGNSCRRGFGENIKLGIYEYFCFASTKIEIL